MKGSPALLAAAVAVLVVGVAAGAWRAADEDVPSERSVDVGFLRDMADHHDQAVQLALLHLGAGEDPVLRGLATDVIASQRYELGLIDARLADWGRGRGSATRRAMTWMGMDSSVAGMPGMATTDELADLAATRGTDADLLFIRLLSDHHEGGIHMAEHAWRHAGTEVVRTLAETIAKAQRAELRDLERSRRRLVGA